MSGEADWLTQLVCQNASSFAFPVDNERTGRTEDLDFPNSGARTRPFLASLASLALAWFGWIFVCLGRAGSARATQ